MLDTLLLFTFIIMKYYDVNSEMKKRIIYTNKKWMCLFVFLLAWIIIIFFRIFCFVFSSFLLLLRSFVRFGYCLFCCCCCWIIFCFEAYTASHDFISTVIIISLFFRFDILEDIELIIIKCIAPQQWEEEEERHGGVVYEEVVFLLYHHHI